MKELPAAIAFLLFGILGCMILTARYINNIPWYIMLGTAAGLILMTGILVWILHGWTNKKTSSKE